MITASPERIGRFQIVEEIGHGAMGTVYLAHDETLGRPVALKTFRPPDETDEAEFEGLRERLLAEAQSAALVSHPNVVTIYDVVEDEAGAGFYIAMEYVSGESLQERLERDGPMSVEEAAVLVSEIAQALDSLHRQGIVHQDIKPENVLFDENGRVKLTDFGIALPASVSDHTTLPIMGTPQYMSPEHLRGERVDARSDVFALGAMLYEMLSGRTPFPGDSVADVVSSILNERYVPPQTLVEELPSPVARVVERALAADPTRRYASAGALAQHLWRALYEERHAIDADDETLHGRTQQLDDSAIRDAAARSTGSRPAVRRRLTIGAALVLVLLLGAWWLTEGPLVSWLAPDVSTPETTSPPTVQHVIEEGRRLLAADDLEGAAVLFATAERLGEPPEATAARALRRVTERRLADQGEKRRLADARQALAEGRYEDVVAGARALLASGSGHDEALAVLTEMERQFEEAARRRQTVPSDAAPRAVEIPSRSTQGSDDSQPAPAPASVELRVSSRLPSGVVTLWVDGEQELRREYAFRTRRDGFLGKLGFKEPGAGSLRQSIRVPAGRHELTVSVAPESSAAATERFTVRLHPGSTHRLEITVLASGEVGITLD